MLNIPLGNILAFDAVYLKNNTSKELYDHIKGNIISYCTD